jgi:hypothetical protein
MTLRQELEEQLNPDSLKIDPTELTYSWLLSSVLLGDLARAVNPFKILERHYIPEGVFVKLRLDSDQNHDYELTITPVERTKENARK